MLFNSFQFALFLPAVLLVLALLPRRARNGFLLVASYVFYGAWDVYFLSLIFLSTVLDYHCGLAIEASTDPGRRKAYVAASACGNLLILGFFKYFDFFVGNLAGLLGSMGFDVSMPVLGLVIPVGISFYTFQTMSYTIDVYRREVPACRRFGDFALFVAFFPQLVAGPIERAGHLLPQVAADRRVDLAAVKEGGWLVFWGFYKKVFVADNLARVADPVFAAPQDHSAWMILLASYAFTIQIYCDFSGYTDIARGVAKWLGFDIMLNFRLPFFATDPSDFWRRWHISLSRWLRDYLYIPLGGNRRGDARTKANLMATMALGGLWHGAQWTFVIWGVYHGLLLVVYRALGIRGGGGIRGWRKVGAILLMFHWTVLGFLVFRIEQTADIAHIARAFLGGWGGGAAALATAGMMAATVALLALVQAAQYCKDDLLVVFRWHWSLRAVLYVVMYLSLTLGGAFDGRQFIYFSF